MRRADTSPLCHRQRVKRFFSLLVVAFTGALAPAAQAQPTEAERLFQEGRDALLAERFSEACPKLEQSQRLEPRVGTLLNLAACHESLGMVATAWDEFKQAREAAHAEGRAAQEAFATERVEALAPRVPWITITPREPVAGIAVALDGEPLDPDEWAVPVAADPGLHVLVAAAPGHAPQEVRFELAEGERETVSIAALVKLPEPAPRPKPTPRPRVKKKATTPPPVAEDDKTGFVFDLGFFGGYLLVHGPDYPTVDGGVDAIDDMGRVTTCSNPTCSYDFGDQGGAAFGVNAFAGYAALDWFHIGGRILAGPRVGGGLVFAGGPVASLHLGGPVWLGAGFILGTASAAGRGTVIPPPGYTLPRGSSYDMEGGIDVGPGPLLELRLSTFELPHGAMELSLTPFAIFSSGSAIAVPLTLAYRFQ
jgi:hypothetical protein